MIELEKKIADAAQAYYTDGSSDLTDSEFDMLVGQLKKENPDSESLFSIFFRTSFRQILPLTASKILAIRQYSYGLFPC